MSEQPGIHDKTFSQASDERIKAAKQLGNLFEAFPDRKQAFEDLLRLCSDSDSEVREEAINSLITVFPNVPEKELVWERFINLTAYPVEEVLKAAVNALITVFPLMSDKKRAWKDLTDLINSKSSLEDVSRGIISYLPDVISEFPDKQQEWKDLLEMTESEDTYIREKAISYLSMVFPELPEYKKSSAWKEMTQLAGEAADIQVKEKAAKLKDRLKEKKETRPEDYYKSAFEKTAFMRKNAANSQESTFLEGEGGKKKGTREEKEVSEDDNTENKQVREKEIKKPAFGLLGLKGDRDEDVLKDTAESFAKRHPEFPDKGVVEELIRLSSDPDPQIRRGAIESLLTIYTRKLGKEQDIWHELLKMSGDTDTGVRKGAASMLSRVFPAVEEKSTVFSDLVRLTESQDTQLRKKAAELLAVAFAYSDDKQKAWNDLLRLTSAEDRDVRKEAVLALSSGYSEVPDKEKVWSDLIKLSTHSDIFVQRVATRTLGPAFFYVPDKTKAWKDLQILIVNPYVYVRRYALRSLGRASLWRALKAENEVTYLFGLKEAVKYFKEASEASTGTSIPEIYYPFYRALLQILFGERSPRLESEQYLSEVTYEIRSLEENQRLLKTVEEFSEFLLAAGNLTGDLPAQKKLLETCIAAFDRVSGLIDTMEENAIFEQKNLRKECSKTGTVVTEHKLKEVLSGIRYKARTACLKAKGKPTEKITCTVSQNVRAWNLQDLEKDRKELDRQLESLLSTLRIQIPYIPENTHIFQKLEDINQEQDLLERYRQVSRLMSMIPGAKMYSRTSGK